MKILFTSPPLRDLGDPFSSGHIRVCAHLGIYLLAALMKKLFPQVKHDGWFKYLDQEINPKNSVVN